MKRQNAVSFLIIFVFLTATGLGCAGLSKKPWRSYQPKPFDAERWRSGDAVERGTMSFDLVGVKTIAEDVGENKDRVLEILGEPYSTRKEEIGGRFATVLIYQVDLGNPEFVDSIEVFFDKEDKTMFANMGVIREKESFIDRYRWKK